MSAPDTEQLPKGGLTAGQEKAAIGAVAAPLVSLSIVSAVLFPDFPLLDPFGGAALALVFLALLFQDLKRPVGQPRLIWFIAVADLATLAIMLGVATIIQAMEWTESVFLGITVGFGGTCLTVGIVLQGLFRAMIRRHDDVADGKESQP